jgi:hypothetical protein
MPDEVDIALGLAKVMDAARLGLGPGDALVVRCAGLLPQAVVPQVQASVRAALGVADLRVLVLDDSVDELAALEAGQARMPGDVRYAGRLEYWAGDGWEPVP